LLFERPIVESGAALAFGAALLVVVIILIVVVTV
jgi:hypothetical protein